jgi:hypothetical protein
MSSSLFATPVAISRYQPAFYIFWPILHKEYDSRVQALDDLTLAKEGEEKCTYTVNEKR